MQKEELRSRVIRVLVEQTFLDESKFVPEATLSGDLWMDSLDRIECAMALELEFGCEQIPVGEFNELRTVQDIFNTVEKYVK